MGCGLCGKKGVVSRLPLILCEAVSLKMCTTQHCFVMSFAASAHSSEYLCILNAVDV